MSQKLVLGKNEKGLTFLELFIVIAIIGILSAIAIPQFSQYKLRMHNNVAKTNLQNIYIACKIYWAGNTDNKPCSIEIIKQEPYGFNASKDIIVAITPGKDTKTNFEATAKHNTSNKTYTINENDNIR